MSVLTRLMPVLSWGINLLLHLGVRMRIFGPMMLLTVRGRKTGKLRTQPVDVHEHDGRRFLIATHGVGSWVYNLRAAGGGVLITRTDTPDERCRLPHRFAILVARHHTGNKSVVIGAQLVCGVPGEKK